jgi:hypothetical protein
MGGKGFGNFWAVPHSSGMTWEATGGNGIGNSMGDNVIAKFWVASFHWNKLGKQRENFWARPHSTGTGSGSNGRQWEAMGGNGFGNFLDGPRSTGTGSGGNGKQWKTMGLVTFGPALTPLGQARVATGSNGRQGFW